MKKLIITGLLAITSTAWAQNTVKVEDAWVRGTVASQKATGAFMRLTSSANARLVAVQSPVAGVVEIHEMAMDKDVMKMRQIPGLELASGKAVELKPGGYHVMLMDLKSQVKDGDAVPLTLTFETKDGKRQTLEVKAPARNMNAPAHSPHGGHSGMKH